MPITDNNYSCLIKAVYSPCLTNHIESISLNIMPLVINSLEGKHTHIRTRLKRSLTIVRITCTNTHTYIPYSTCIVVLSVSNPMILSALHLKTSPLLASAIVIVETLPLVG